MLPNRAETIQTLLAVFQAGWNYVPLNNNLTASEVAYILADSGAKVLIADERFAAVAAAAAERGRTGARGSGEPAARSPGSPRSTTCSPSSPTRRPTIGWPGSSCSTRRARPGRPKAVQRELPDVRPGDLGGALQRQPLALRHRARRRRRAPRDLADVPHGPAVVRLLLRPLRAPRGAHGPLGRGDRAPADRALPRDRHPHGADPAAPADAAPRRRPQPLRRDLAAAGGPRRRALPDRAQAPALRLARPGDLRVLRRDRGRRHHRQAGRLAGPPRHGRIGRGRAGA